MKYEVINNNGQVVMWTESSECVPNLDMLKVISDSGYRHKVDGKIIAYNKIDAAISRTISTADSQKVVRKSRKLF